MNVVAAICVAMGVIAFAALCVYRWREWRSDVRKNALYEAKWQRSLRRDNIARLERELGIGQQPYATVTTVNEEREAQLLPPHTVRGRR